jgi:hypothetical protein
MRYIKDIPHDGYKISIYQWNGKFIIKFEAGGMYEQIYKVDQTDVSTVEEIETIVDDELILKISKRFAEMHGDLNESLKRHDLLF